jgi:hypothetical protein
MVHTIHLAGPAGSHTSQPDLIAGYKISDKTRFLYNYFVTGEDDKVVFSIIGDIVSTYWFGDWVGGR